MKFNLGTNAKPQLVKINAQLKTSKVLEMEHLLKKFKFFFAWTYKDWKGIPLKLTQHKIELDAIIPPTHQAKYRLNPNCATIIKQDITKLLAVRFIQSIEEATWLSPIVVAPKKNDKLKICIVQKTNTMRKSCSLQLVYLVVI
jgi:hypothetical protein